MVDVRGRWIPAARTVEHGIRCAILTVFIEGVRRWDVSAIVNAVFTLASTYLPAIVTRQYDIGFRPWQRVYMETAMLTHAVGMLGLYDDTWWWDHLTHTHSATLVGGVVHVAALRRGRDPHPRVLVVIVGGGVLWELMEYATHALTNRLGLQPVLIPYSIRDTLVDLVFNLLGALLVLLFGDRLLRNVTRDIDDAS